MKIKNYTLAISLICSFSAASAFADATDGFANVYQAIFGKENARKVATGASDCGNHDRDGGIIGGINGFFCHMRFDMGLTALGSSTKLFGTTKVHAEFVQGCTGSDGNTYNLGASVWTCDTGSLDCTVRTNFSRAAAVCFNTTADYQINTGVMIVDNGAFKGSGGTSAVYAAYDLGSASTNQRIQVKMINVSSQTFKGRVDGTRSSANQLTATAVVSTANGGTLTTANSARFALTLNRQANTLNAYMEGFGSSGNGTGTYSATNASDTPATGVCLSRTATTKDWTYSVTSSGASCAPSVTFPSDNITAVEAYTYATIVGTFNGMTTNPSAL